MWISTNGAEPVSGPEKNVKKEARLRLLFVFVTRSD
jgi:hypothetical protein